MSEETRRGAETGPEDTGPEDTGPEDTGPIGEEDAGGGRGEEEGTETGADAEGSERRERSRDWSTSFSEIQETVGELVDGVIRGFAPFSGGRFPRYDLIRIPGEGYRVLMDLPGVAKEDVDVSTVGEEIVVSGERHRPDVPPAAEIHRSERGYGRFRRAFRLPADVDPAGIAAKLEDGVLRLLLPIRTESERQRVEIE